ncbi:POTRA domain-containing protein, partial [bacterium]
MNKKIINIILLSLLVIVSYLNAAESENNKIFEIVISGNKHIKESIIKGRISTKRKQNYDEEKVNEDIRSILTLGSFDDVEAEIIEDVLGIKLIYKVTEKPHIKSIDFQGNENYSNRVLKKKVESKIKEAFDTLNIDKDKENIISFYKKKGYVDIKVDSFFETNEDTNETSLTF